MSFAFMLVAAPLCMVSEGSARDPMDEVHLAQEYSGVADLEGFLEEDRAWLRGEQSSVAAPVDPEVLRIWVEERLAPADTSMTRKSGVRDVASRLRDRWFARGYPAAKVISTTSTRTSGGRRLLVNPGEPYEWGVLDVGGPDFFRREELLSLCLPERGAPFAAADLDRAAGRILAGLGEIGYPFGRWLVKTVILDTLRHAVDVEAALYPGHAAVWGSFESNLPKGRGENFLFRATGLRSGSPFRESELLRARQKLLLRGIYQRVEGPLLYRRTAPDTVWGYWFVEERRKANRIAVVVGLSRRKADEEARLSGEIDLNLPNLAGTGRHLRVRWSDDGGDRSRLSFGYLEPLAFGTPLDLDISIDHEVLTDVYTLFRVETTAKMALIAAWGIELGFGWDRSTFPLGDVERSTRVRARGALSHRRMSFQHSGWSALLALERAARVSYPRAVADGGEEFAGATVDDNQTLLAGDLDGEVCFASAWALAGRGSWREVQSGQVYVPLVEQYRFGGATTVRGRRENEFHGSTVAWASLELRVGRPGGSRLYTFYDMGYFRYSALDPTGDDADARVIRKDIVRGFGLGLRTKGAGGDISLAIGFPGEMDFESARLHVTLLEAF